MSYDNRPEGCERRGNWMQTYSGGVIYPLDPRPEEIHIADIAHALSNMCRFGGHCNGFYSVAEHSVLVSRCVPQEHALTALMHDATEAYLVDIPRPIKYDLGNYVEIEDQLWLAIAEKWSLPAIMPSEVKAADNAVLLAEAQQIMKPAPLPWSVPGEPAPVMIACMAPKDAKAFFLARYEELTNG